MSDPSTIHLTTQPKLLKEPISLLQSSISDFAQQRECWVSSFRKKPALWYEQRKIEALGDRKHFFVANRCPVETNTTMHRLLNRERSSESATSLLRQGQKEALMGREKRSSESATSLLRQGQKEALKSREKGASPCFDSTLRRYHEYWHRRMVEIRVRNNPVIENSFRLKTIKTKNKLQRARSSHKKRSSESATSLLRQGQKEALKGREKRSSESATSLLRQGQKEALMGREKIAGSSYMSTTGTTPSRMNRLEQESLEGGISHSKIVKIEDSSYMSTTGTTPSRMNRLEQESLEGGISHSELEKLQELISELLKKIRDNDSEAFMAKADNRISKKDDLNQTVNDKLTLLMSACYHSRKDIVKFLLERGCDVNLKSNPHWTALMFAAHAGCAEIVKLLLDKGAKINDVNSLGSTALILATSKGHKEVVELLLNKGADKGIVNNAGWTAQEIAEEKAFTDIASLFK